VQTVDLQATCTQEAFGRLVGISQQAVSDLASRGVLTAGQTIGTWLLAYCAHIREQAAGRSESELTSERARLAREQADRVAMHNALRRKEVAPVAILEEVLAHVARQISARLDALVPELKRCIPDLPPEALQLVGERVAVVRAAAAGVRLSTADEIAAQEAQDEADA
jgi:phage terminase Nu1 subunit (DNA packaging protein)